PLASVATFVCSPFTLPFWLVVANTTEAFVLKIDAATDGTTHVEIDSGRWQKVGWFPETAGVTAFGFVLLSILTASVGYVLAGFIWRFIVARKRRRIRQARRRAANPAE